MISSRFVGLCCDEPGAGISTNVVQSLNLYVSRRSTSQHHRRFDLPGGYRLIEYLRQTQIHKEVSFGLSLSIGPWAASGVDRVVTEWKEQADLEGRQRWSFTGQRTYTGKWGGATTQYAFGLGAATIMAQ